MKRNKKLIQLVILLILLVLISAGYFFLQYANQKQEKEKQKAEEAKTITLGSVDKDKIAAFSFVKDGKTYSLKKAGNTWNYEEDRNFPVDPDKVSTLLDQAATVKASRLVEDSKAHYDDFGLSNPSNVIGITDSTGKTTTYKIGNANSVTSEYYAAVEGKDSVYMVSSEFPKAFGIGLYDLVKMDSFPEIDSSAIYHMSGMLSNQNFDFTRKKMESNGNETVKWEGMINGSTTVTVDSGKMDTLLNSIHSLAYDREVEYNCTGDNLSKYGLTNPVASLTIDYTVTTARDDVSSDVSEESGMGTSTETMQESITLYVGSKTPDGGYYIKTDQSNAVYAITGTIADQISNLITK